MMQKQLTNAGSVEREAAAGEADAVGERRGGRGGSRIEIQRGDCALDLQLG